MNDSESFAHSLINGISIVMKVDIPDAHVIISLRGRATVSFWR